MNTKPLETGVAVGRDDAVRRRVGAVAEAGLEPDRDLGALAAGVERLAGLDLLAGRVEHPQRAEARLDGLVEAEHDLRRRACRACAPRSGTVDCSVACANAVAGSGEQCREGERERAPHHASATSSRAAAVARGGATKNTASESTITSAARPKIAPSGSRALVERDPRQRAGDRALLVADLDRHLPVVELRLDVLVLELRRIALAHPVRAVVMPLEARALGHLLPHGRGRKVLRHRGLAQAVLVEVVRLGAGVDLDRAVGEQLRVRLALVVA